MNTFEVIFWIVAIFGGLTWLIHSTSGEPDTAADILGREEIRNIIERNK